jgi:hypothetical protein
MLKSIAESGSPCRNPRFCWNAGASHPLMDPGGRPSTDFELVSPFQIIFDPKMKQRGHIDWLLSPWRDLIFMKLQVDRIMA